MASITFKNYGFLELINAFPAPDGGLMNARPGFETNAVLVQLFEQEQEDGTIEISRVVSLLCTDDDMLPALRAEALRIMAA